MLIINNLHVTVDNKEVVKGVSLEINPGEIHALMGPNGSGKSSLAMAIAGHPRYTVGKEEGVTITLDGEDITDKTPDERARMGLFLASQYPVGVGGITVEQLLRRAVQEKLTNEQTDKLTKKITNDEKSKFVDALKFRKDLEKLAEKVGVNKELLRRSINVGFSGGEKKRLEVLQMLTLQPKYAILDETDSGLDIDALKTIAGMVKTAKWPDGSKPGILVITHYAKLLHHLKPDYIHVMKDGKITESGGEELGERVEKEGYVSFCSDSTK
ncbi:MAG: Fe-S cluster assembly ATPase SufC [Patescibacteria group bacterium]